MNFLDRIRLERGILAVRHAVEMLERILDHVKDVELGVAQLGERARVGQRVA